MRKLFVRAVPVFILVFFIIIMLSGKFLKYPLGKNDNIPVSIQLIAQDVKNEDWDAASAKVDQLSGSWDKVARRVQFSSERGRIDELYINIARLRGAIIAKDKSAALEELSEAYEHWKELGK